MTLDPYWPSTRCAYVEYNVYHCSEDRPEYGKLGTYTNLG